MKQGKVKQLVVSSVFAALICVATMVIKIPAGQGYLHPGDGFVLLAGFLLGPWYGAAAAGLGSGLADLFAGYTLYAPATVVIKALTAFCASKYKKTTPSALLFGGLGEGIMVAGYFLYEWALYGRGAIAGLPGNLIQGIGGVVLAILLLPFLKRLVKNQ